MIGEASPEFFQLAAKATADALPDGRYRSLEGQYRVDDAAEALAPVLSEFLG